MTRIENIRNLLSFWIFGLCNNFGYVLMLSAAQDILSKGGEIDEEDGKPDVCLNSTSTRYCSQVSTGVVLLCNIFPGLIIKILAPFFIYRIPYGFVLLRGRLHEKIIKKKIRHVIVCTSTIFAFFITAFSGSVIVALFGVLLTSFASGLGENSFLSLASHYPPYSISSWSSGTGAAGIVGSFVYAALTDPYILAFSPTETMLVALIVPIVFAATYFCVLVMPPTIKIVSISEPDTWIDLDVKSSSQNSSTPTSNKLSIIRQLLVYIIPIALVYYAEYFINQGLVELSVFDCEKGFGTSPGQQYRWYQVLYQIGVFISRSSSDVIQLSMTWITLLPVLQFVNVLIFLSNALHPFLPNFGVACGLVMFEGLIGGASYVNSFRHIHQNVDVSIREFALGACSMSDGIGILLAAFSAIPVHNSICKMGYL